jgi:hypothetical protein
MDDSMEILLEQMAEADTVPELQTHVLAFNKYAEEHFGSAGIEFAGEGEVSDTRVDALVTWIEALQDQMEDVTRHDRVESYSITVSGSLTGPSVSVGVTCLPDDPE